MLLVSINYVWNVGKSWLTFGYGTRHLIKTYINACIFSHFIFSIASKHLNKVLRLKLFYEQIWQRNLKKISNEISIINNVFKKKELPNFLCSLLAFELFSIHAIWVKCQGNKIWNWPKCRKIDFILVRFTCILGCDQTCGYTDYRTISPKCRYHLCFASPVPMLKTRYPFLFVDTTFDC